MDDYIYGANEAELNTILADLSDEPDQEGYEELENELRQAIDAGRNFLIRNIKEGNDNTLMHYGVGPYDNPPGRGSGRYEVGTGENPGQHEPMSLSKQVKTLHDQGMGYGEIAKALGYKSSKQLRAYITIEKERREALYRVKVPELRSQGLTIKEIMARTGLSDGSVRNYLNQDRVLKSSKAAVVTNTIKQEVDTKDYLDVGSGTELECGVSKTMFETAVSKLEAEGYRTYFIKVEQLGNPGKFTTVKVLGKPTDKDDKAVYKELYEDLSKIRTISNYFVEDEDSMTSLGLQPVRSISSDRIHIRYGDEQGPDGATGEDREGIIQLRRGVDEISLGRSNYSQVRIAVDDSHYLKGMAIYGDDDLFPPGCDIIYNTSKASGTDKYKVFKEMKKNADGTINRDNPFGATIKEYNKDLNAGGQSYYTDPETGKRLLRVINKVNDQGDYGEWSRKISAQMLSKQPPELVQKQLSLTIKDRNFELDDIRAITNPTVKKKLLESFAEDCDAAASHLKAKAFPGQTTNVLIALPSLKEDECYTPNYPNGERLALVRYPHAGPAEIVVVRNNTSNAEGIKTLGINAPDAIGLHPSQYPKLSGADSDGDTVVTIPMSTANIKSQPMFEGMQGFNPKSYKLPGPDDPKAPGYIPGISSHMKQVEMGKVTNLIADMGLQGAPPHEMVWAIKHSQVVIDAEKHHLDWKKSEEDFHIRELKQKWQNGGGASTLITRAKSEDHHPERKPGIYTDPVTGKTTRGVNPNTGELIWENTGKTYTKKVTPAKKDPYFKEETKMEVTTKMDMTNDAMTLLSHQSNAHPNEVHYGNYANALKQLANQARKEAVNTPKLQKDPQAAKEYASEVKSIETKLTEALKNAPRERQAQIASTLIYRAQVDANPDISNDKAALKRLKGQALTSARHNVGAKKPRVELNDREIEAIQKGAISDTKLKQVLDNADMDIIRKAFTPKTTNGISTSMETLAKSMAANGYTNADIAARLGISSSSVSRIINAA